MKYKNRKVIKIDLDFILGLLFFIKGEIIMPVKLKDTYIKAKIKAKFGEIEVYNAINNDIKNELIQMIRDNSKLVTLENGMSDIKIDNMNKTMKYMFSHLTNLEDENYWNSIDDIEFENMLNLSDGDFKDVVNELLDIIFETTQDIRKEDIRKLKIISDKLEEMTEIFKFNTNIDNKLKEFGLDKELFAKIQNGDKEAIEQFQKNLIEQAEKVNKPKRKYTKKAK